MLYRFLPIITVIITLLATSYISLLPLNGVSQADVSNKFPTLLTPAPFTFSIWGLIYVTWIVSAFLIAIKSIEVGKKQKVVFSLTVALTAFWLIPWHYERVLVSLFVLLWIFACASFLFLHTRKKETSLVFKYTTEITYSWIIIATILNTFVYMQAVWTIQNTENILLVSLLGIFVWCMVHIVLLNGFKAYLPIFVYVWALWGIYSAQPLPSVRLTAIIIAIILLIDYIYERRKAYKRCLEATCKLEKKLSKELKKRK